MSSMAGHSNEVKAAGAFSRQSEVFDQLYGTDEIIAYKRQRVRDHVMKHLQPQSSILELNCGTGEDALFFASKGYRVHATDISADMLKKLRGKTEDSRYENSLSFEQCSFTALHALKNRGPFDAVFSNFGGLNCTEELDKVLQSFPALVRPGGTATLVIISKFCLWETLLIFKGRFKTAFRRFFSSKGRQARVEGRYFKCWYYRPSYVVRALRNDFDLLGIEGLCTVVPPSYIEGFARKYPKAFDLLKKTENKWAAKWPWKYMGDYYIISLKKR